MKIFSQISWAFKRAIRYSFFASNYFCKPEKELPLVALFSQQKLRFQLQKAVTPIPNATTIRLLNTIKTIHYGII